RHTRTGRPAKKTWNVSAGTITGSSTKPAGPSNTTTASTSGPPPTDTATTANPTPSPNQHHPHHRPCRQTNHHHSERVLFRVGLTCGDAELWTAPRTAEPQVILATGWWPEAVQKLRRTEDDQGGHLARSMFDHDVLPGFPNGFNHSGHSLRSRSR